jgi:hypothetical protein
MNLARVSPRQGMSMMMLTGEGLIGKHLTNHVSYVRGIYYKIQIFV